MFEIIPSIASSDLLDVRGEIRRITPLGSLHLDIEDGNFVPNITFGKGFISRVSNECRLVMDAHLMVLHPAEYLEFLQECGFSRVCIHYESTNYPLRELNMIRRLGMSPGLALNFKTDWKEIEPFLDYVDYVLVMTAGPDDRGEIFQPVMLKKIRHLREILPAGKQIWADGGIGEKELFSVWEAGVQIVIMGRYLFSQENPVEIAEKLKALVIEWEA